MRKYKNIQVGERSGRRSWVVPGAYVSGFGPLRLMGYVFLYLLHICLFFVFYYIFIYLLIFYYIYVGDLGQLLGPSLAVFGCFGGLCWWSEADHGTSVGSLGPLEGLCGRS